MLRMDGYTWCRVGQHGTGSAAVAAVERRDGWMDGRGKGGRENTYIHAYIHTENQNGLHGDDRESKLVSLIGQD